jgi:hypothetical protein
MAMVMTRDDATIRYRLREARATLKFRAPSSAVRRRTFLAALQQFEELLGAAAAVGPASRPLPLFYALSQGGRAITAAHALGVWELAGHGISMPPQSSSLPLLKKQSVPRPGKSDSFHHVAATIGSAPLTGPVEIGALWASLPFDLAKTRNQNWPEVLQLHPDPQSRFLSPTTQELKADLIGVTFSRLRAGDVRRLLVNYPTTKGWYFPGGGNPVGRKTEDGWQAQLAWTVNGTSAADRMARLTEIALAYRYQGHHWLRPAVGAQKDCVKPLVTWWALLYGLSIVARYEPAAWAKALSIDSSKVAAPLESLLDEAMLDIPQLVLEALEGQPFLFRPPFP